ncbi:hypothetical protein ABLE94_02965 [Gordonia sp. VNK1]|uniref:hypothetical protein n=1 Tax=Gordonia oleivorans TaxID=3156618 RepID=UPI0032B4AB6D
MTNGDNIRRALESADANGQFGPVLAFTLFFPHFLDVTTTDAVRNAMPELGAVAAEESLTEFIVRRGEVIDAMVGRTLQLPPVLAAPGVAWLLLDSADPDQRTIVTVVRRPQSPDEVPGLDHWRVLAVGAPVEPEDIDL